MKRLVTAAIVLSLMFSAVPMNLCYAGTQYQENAVDKAGDWFATLGKKNLERDRILAQRRAERMARHTEREARKVQREAEKARADAQKKLGY